MNAWCKSALIGLQVTAMAATAAASPDERFGVMTHFAQGWSDGIVAAIARTPVREVRDELYWKEVERTAGRFSFPRSYDHYMAELKGAGISPLIVLSFGNPNYDGGETPHTDAGIAAFARYAAAVVQRYPGQIHAVEVWNEYNGDFCHGPAARDRAGNYLRLLRATFAAVKRVRPDVQVVGGATSGVPLPYWEELLAGGGLAWMDALSVHPYRYDSAPEGIGADIGRLRDLETRYAHGSPKPIWVTEIGWVIRPRRAPGDIVIDDATQAQFLVRAYALLLSSGVSRTYWYLFADDPNLPMGLVQHDSALSRRPAELAMRTLVDELHEAAFVARDPTKRGLYSIRFRRSDGTDLRVMWSLSPQAVDLTGATDIVDLTGRKIPLRAAFELGPSPVFVAGPVGNLPPPDVEIVADAQRDFTGRQGAGGWFYGERTGRDGAFKLLPTFGHDDWHYTWSNGFPYLAITATDQHPSVVDGRPVAAVRRWQSNFDGMVRVSGEFRAQPAGDGVGVRLSIDGRPQLIGRIGGGNPITRAFDLNATVHRGSIVELSTDPGPGTDINSDATVVQVEIARRKT